MYRYILFLADFARHKFPEEIDSYADFYYWDIDVADIKQVWILFLYAANVLSHMTCIIIV